MNSTQLDNFKDKLLSYIGSKEYHIEYYGKYDQCETYYLYVSEIEDIIEEFFEEEKKNAT